MADQAGMMAVNRAVEAVADDPAPLGAFVRGAYRRLRAGPYRVLYEVEGNLITIPRHDNQFVIIGLSLVPGPVWPVARCRLGLGRRRGPRSLTGSTPPNEPSLSPSPLSGTRQSRKPPRSS